MEDIENLTLQEIQMLNKIRKIRDSLEVKEIIRRIAAHAENMGASRAKHRIKKEDSAVDKFREKKYTNPYSMGDICGMMIIVEDENQIYSLVEFFKTMFPNISPEVDDYIKNPKLGYRSVHMNFRINGIEELGEEELPLEIQIKTRAMAIAQDTVHDSIYKNQTLAKIIRNQLSEAIFPIVEKTYEIEQLTAAGNIERVAELKKEINEIMTNNAQVFKENYPIERVWREYAKNIFKHKNEIQIDREAFFNGDTPSEKVKRMMRFEDAIDAIYDYFKQEGISNGQLSDSMQYATEKMRSLDYKSFSDMLVYIHNDIEAEEIADKEQPTVEQSVEEQTTEISDSAEIKPGSIADFAKIHAMIPAKLVSHVAKRLKDLKKLRERGDHFIGK